MTSSAFGLNNAVLLTGIPVKKASYLFGNILSETYKGTLISDIFLILTDDQEFKNLSLNKINILTNSNKILSLKHQNISNIDEFLIKYSDWSIENFSKS